MNCSKYYSSDTPFPETIVKYLLIVFIITPMTTAIGYRTIYKCLCNYTSYFSQLSIGIQNKIIFHYIRVTYLSFLLVAVVNLFVKIWYSIEDTVCSTEFSFISCLSCILINNIFSLDILINKKITVNLFIHHIFATIVFCYYMSIGPYDIGFVLIATGYVLNESLGLYQSVCIISRNIPQIYMYHSNIALSSIIQYALRVTFHIVYIGFILITYNKLFTTIQITLHITILFFQTLLNIQICYHLFTSWKRN